MKINEFDFLTGLLAAFMVIAWLGVSLLSVVKNKNAGGLARIEDDGITCAEFCFNPTAVEYVQREMLSEKESTLLTDIFKTLSSKTRIRILHALSLQELCVCDLSVALDLSVSAISHQLRLLKAVRLVKYRRDGKNVYYSLDDDHVVSLFARTLEHVRHT